jgi:hypothetical protein
VREVDDVAAKPVLGHPDPLAVNFNDIPVVFGFILYDNGHRVSVRRVG